MNKFRTSVLTLFLFALSLLHSLVSGVVLFEGTIVHPNVQTIFQDKFPTQIQDAIVRSTHPDQLLVTYALPAYIRLIKIGSPEPQTPNNTLLYKFDYLNAVLGITELAPDVYAVLTGNTRVFPSYQGAPGSYQVFQLDLTHYDTNGTIEVTRIADLSECQNCVAITTVPATPPILLVADTQLGQIYKVDTTRTAPPGIENDSNSSILMADDTMKPMNGASLQLGIAGLRYAGNHVYYTNTYAHGLYRIALDQSTSALGPANSPTVYNYSTLAPAGGPQTLIQDSLFPRALGLAVRGQGADLDILVCGSNAAYRVGQTIGAGWGFQVLAGGSGEALLMGVTNAEFGTGPNVNSLFVTTGGSLGSAVPGARFGAQVLWIKL